MTNWCMAWLAAATVQAVLFSLAPVPAAGQTQTATETGVVRRTAEGTPDLSGIWQVMNTAAWDIQDHPAQKGVPAGQGVVEGNELPYLPAAAAKKQANYDNRATADPETKCYLPGVPRITYMPYPFQITQSQKQVTILYEYVHAVRNIFLGTPHIKGPIDWWMGDSRGRWEGNTLVVDVLEFNDETWFDRAGNFHSGGSGGCLVADVGARGRPVVEDPPHHGWLSFAGRRLSSLRAGESQDVQSFQDAGRPTGPAGNLGGTGGDGFSEYRRFSR